MQPPTKKKKTESTGTEDWLASNVDDIQDIDLEVYGTKLDDLTATTTSTLRSYNFEVCDSVLNIGPCGHVSMGEPTFLSEVFNSSVKADPDVELVSTSGHGKNGALCVLQQTIRPQVVTTFELPGVNDMWTVIGKAEGKGHAFMVLSRSDSTMVLQTGQEINELDQSGFYTEGPTVYCGNIGVNQFIIQVYANGVRLLEGSSLIQNLPVELGSSIVSVSRADPYLLAWTEDGQLVLLTLETVSFGRSKAPEQMELTMIKANLKSKSAFVTACAYKDISGLFTTELPEELSSSETVTKQQQQKQQQSASNQASAPAPEIDDEDELLYGESAPNLFESAASEVTTNKASGDKGAKSSRWIKFLEYVKPTYWGLVLRENGSVEIMSLPDFTVKYIIANFNLAPNVLADSLFTSTPKGAPEPAIPESAPKINEIFMVGLGENQRRPHLFARTEDHELLAYEVYPYYEPSLDQEQLKFRFRKIRHGLLLRQRRSHTRADKPAKNRNQIRYFADIAGYEGVFLCGPYPHWLIMTNRGILRTHPMGIDASVPCFSPFDNVNCPRGFIYFNRKVCNFTNKTRYFGIVIFTF